MVPQGTPPGVLRLGRLGWRFGPSHFREGWLQTYVLLTEVTESEPGQICVTPPPQEEVGSLKCLANTCKQYVGI